MIREIKALSTESTEQSSESWHDNYNFEESQRQLKMLLNHLGGLSNASERSVVVELPEQPDVVEVGVRVEFKNLSSNHVDTFNIGSYYVSDELRDLDFISYDTPIARALLGARVGDQRTAKIGGREVQLEVIALESVRPYLPEAQVD